MNGQHVLHMLLMLVVLGCVCHVGQTQLFVNLAPPYFEWSGLNMKDMKSVYKFAFDVLKRWSPYGCKMKRDLTGLSRFLTEGLHGQHLVMEPVVKLLTKHLADDDPDKPLILSLHGPSGTGKTFVAELIADYMYHEGTGGSYVGFANAAYFSNEETRRIQMALLYQNIVDMVTARECSMFIFDDVRHFPEGLLDSIFSHLHANGVNYRKSIFILTSDLASEKIIDIAVRNHVTGRLRTDITLEEMGDAIKRSTFNEEGGLHHSSLIEKGLIAAYIPFLPLERRHIRMCAEDGLRTKYSMVSYERVDSLVDQIHSSFWLGGDWVSLKSSAADLLYWLFPSYNTANVAAKLFPSGGCKPVQDKVNVLLLPDKSEL